MIHSMRWFGPQDPMPLSYISQAGCSGVVNALHQIPVGEVWTLEEILKRKTIIEATPSSNGFLTWNVVESLPVHESIKKGLPDRDLYISNYLKSLENLSKAGIKTVCYNFMPVLDWSRTDLKYILPSGAKALRFEIVSFIVFDLFILKRPGAKADYAADLILKAELKWADMTDSEKAELQNTVLLGLPGSEEAFTLETFQTLLDNYKNIGETVLKENLFHFIKSVCPVAESLGIKLCIHPDDPPYPLLGLPRVVSTASDLRELFNIFPGITNGLTFCTGSLGVRKDNKLLEIFTEFKERVHFLHLRATKTESIDSAGKTQDFHEADHLYGDVDMVSLINLIVKEENHRKSAIPMRPDHGHQMLDDLERKSYPGYSAVGRLKGLAELRGVENAVKNSFL